MSDVNTMPTPYLPTTIDNPWNPFTQWDNWEQFDREHGYGTMQYLARILIDAPDLTEKEKTLAINSAVDEIVHLNILGIYRKIGPTDQPKPVPVV